MEVSELHPQAHRFRLPSLEAVFAISCVLLGALGLKLVYDPLFWNEYFYSDHPVGDERKVQVGTLEPLRIGVRYRSLGSPVWNDVDSTVHPIFDGQSIFTNESGRALIRLNSGVSAEVLESSLITIYQEKPAESGVSEALPVLQVQKGSAALSAEANAKPAKLLVDGKLFEVKKQSPRDAYRMKISRVGQLRNDGTLRVEVTQGAAVQLESKGVSQVVKAGEIASVALVGGSTAAPQLRVQDQQVVKLRDTRPKKFEVPPALLGSQSVHTFQVLQPDSLDEWWLPLEWPRVEGAQNYHLEIANEAGRSFASPLLKEAHWIWKLSTLESRRFQYRVTALFDEGEKLSSDWQKLEIQPMVPEITAPIRGARLFLDDLDRSPLVWKRTRLSRGYEIQLSQDPGFQKQAYSQKTSQNFIWLTRLAPGKWYWRVRAILSDGVSDWSDASSFTWLDSSPVPSEPSPE